MNTAYDCPKCGGRNTVVKAAVGRGFRWTCTRCERDYCYNTEEPCLGR